MSALPLSFLQPLMLLGLLTLPLLWWLLRVMPPRPRRVDFPPTQLLFDIAPKEETPSRTPWWLTALRLAAAALVIFAAAGPVWNPKAGARSTAPLTILLDDGWSAASSWETRIRAADELIAEADNDGRGVAIVPLSEPARDITLMPAGTARVALRQLAPKPFAVERVETLPALERFLKATGDSNVVWLSDGIDSGRGADFVDGLRKAIGDRSLTIVEGGAQPAHALVAAENAAARMTVKILRSAANGPQAGVVRALDQKGSPIGETRFAFPPQDRETEAAFDLPLELRNDIARLEIAGERSAGAVQLLDKRWRRRAIGVVSGSSADTAQPLLASTFYLTRALEPFADVRLGDKGAPQQVVTQFLDQKLPMIVMADVGALSPELRQRIDAWLDRGGVLVRFAGPRLAQADDDLVPVKLRHGGRSLGGSMTWEKPQHLAAFAADGPFAGLTVPNDVTVNRQVLAEPDAALAAKSWASLLDGTPLVTGERRGKGLLALFHVSADMRWSDLPMSGAFVEMLRRIVDASGYTANTGKTDTDAKAETVAPLRTLDGFGVLTPPPGTAKPLPVNYRGRGTVEHPPGFYGPADGPIAVNTLAATDRIVPLDTSTLMARRASFTNAEPHDLRGILLSSALALFLVDAVIVALLGGGLAALLRRRAAPAALLLALVLPMIAAAPSPSRADSAKDEFAMKATSQTRLAYVVTGNADVDNIVKAGMSGLTLFLAQRTALEAGDPVGIDPARDELAFFPLIYWPIVPGAPKPSQSALNKIDAYMKQGGTVLFDTRDAIDALPGDGGESQTPGMQELRTILSSLDIPELEPVPHEHVLAKTFYLLHDFPGRFTTGQTWVEALPRNEDDEAASRPARGGDGVSPIIITSNDLAGAWAMRPDGQPMLPLSPGEPRQREFAFRAGVNIVMYTLTGNYKADQVHAPALIERLGQ
ncbi:MAG: DUF4159 domain-containing protein [Nitrobacter sp.]